MIAIKTDDQGKVVTKYNGPAPGADWTELSDSEWPDVDYAADYIYDDQAGTITAEKVETSTSTNA